MLPDRSPPRTPEATRAADSARAASTEETSTLPPRYAERAPRESATARALGSIAHGPRLRGADLHQDILGRLSIERHRLTRHLAKAAPAIARNRAAVEREHSSPNDRKLQRVERVREDQLHGL